jgi:DNA modification methylase
MELDKIYNQNCSEGLKTLPDNSINCCVTSPPYWGLRNYGHKDQLGLEKTPEEYVAKLIEIFREVKRTLKKNGTLWLNLGDSYAGSGKGMNANGKQSSLSKKQASNKGTVGNGTLITKNFKEINRKKDRSTTKWSYSNCKATGDLKPKDLIGIPWMVAFALRADGWYLRQDIIWSKPNPMPESVTDRCTKAHEYIFLLSKSQKYHCDMEAIQEIASGYDGRKDTKFKGGIKYLGHQQQTMLSRGHERWKYKNLQKEGQTPNSMHEKRLVGEEYMSPVRNKRSVWEYNDNYSLWEWLFQNAPIEIIKPLWDKFIEDSVNKGSVWQINTMPYSEAHFATFPEKLIVDCIKAGCPKDSIVLDPFMGAGTTGLVAKKLNRHYIGFELNPEYIKIAQNRIFNEIGLFL